MPQKAASDVTDEGRRPLPRQEPSANDEEGEPTGYTLLGEGVRWQDGDIEWSREVKDRVRGLIMGYLEPALPIAETFLKQQHDEAGEEEPLEVWQVGVAVVTEQPENETDVYWELNIEVNHAGACPSHFLIFRNGELIEATAAN